MSGPSKDSWGNRGRQACLLSAAAALLLTSTLKLFAPFLDMAERRRPYPVI